MKTRKIIMIMVGLLLISATAFAQSMQRPMRAQRPGWNAGRGMMQRLNLTKDQQNKLLDMRLAMQREMLPLRNQLVTLRSDLKLELTANKFDQNKVNKTVDQMANVRKQMNLKRIEHMRNVRNILTPDQQKTFDLMVMNHRRGGFMQHRPMRNWGGRGMRNMRPGMGAGMWNR